MTPSMTGTGLPKMTAAKGRPTRILTPAQIARRKARQALGITDIRKATPAQLAKLKKQGIAGPGHDEVTQRVLDRLKANAGAPKPVSIPIVSTASNSGQLSQVGGKKRKKKQTSSSMSPPASQFTNVGGKKY